MVMRWGWGHGALFEDPRPCIRLKHGRHPCGGAPRRLDSAAQSFSATRSICGRPALFLTFLHWWRVPGGGTLPSQVSPL